MDDALCALPVVRPAYIDERRWRALTLRMQAGLTFRAIGQDIGCGYERARQLVYSAARQVRAGPPPPLPPTLTAAERKARAAAWRARLDDEALEIFSAD